MDILNILSSESNGMLQPLYMLRIMLLKIESLVRVTVKPHLAVKVLKWVHLFENWPVS